MTWTAFESDFSISSIENNETMYFVHKMSWLRKILDIIIRGMCFLEGAVCKYQKEVWPEPLCFFNATMP